MIVDHLMADAHSTLHTSVQNSHSYHDGHCNGVNGCCITPRAGVPTSSVRMPSTPYSATNSTSDQSCTRHASSSSSLVSKLSTAWTYVHCTGGMFAMVPAYEPRFEVTTNMNSENTDWAKHTLAGQSSSSSYQQQLQPLHNYHGHQPAQQYQQQRHREEQRQDKEEKPVEATDFGTIRFPAISTSQ
ncbi:unnamed protein product, partial [Protopolystoma xenopodis]